ncbi:MAG: Do family serine endopeptidase [Deltaproteobacteria bacterium]
MQALAVAVVATAMYAAPPALALAEGTFSPTMVSDVAERVTPAVVNITTRKNRRDVSGLPPAMRPFLNPRGGRLPPEMGAGSGVVISPDGTIITNNHVIDGADEIKVTFSNARELSAKLVGTDKASDIAVLKVEAKALPYLSLGDSAALRLGEFVLAVGNPFGVGQTVTMGIVSAKGRANMGIVDYEDFIQTDASINPGNSGGALVNLKGELVGINTAILSRSGGAQGIGFAVPSNMVRPIKDQIAKFGRVRRGWLGVAIQDLTPELRRGLGLGAVTQGVLVSEVMDGGPAAKGNLEVRDVVVKVNDRPTKSVAQLRNRIALTAPGSKAKLTVVREGREKNLFILLDEKKDDAQIASLSPSDEAVTAGLRVENIDQEDRKRLRIPRKVTGVLVAAVEPGSAADRSGLEVGDVITAVGRKSVRSAKSLDRMIPKGAKEVVLRVFKRGVFTFVVLRP